MRKYLALGAILALTACGGGGGATSVPSGGGGSGATPTPTSTPGSGTQAKYVTPTFHITIPKAIAANTRTAKGKTPQFVSTNVASITITLTDVNGSPAPTLAGNPATTAISSATCSSGCTVNGPPSPLGSDTFLLTTYDGSNKALDTATGTYTMTQGQNNPETVTLEGIPATITVSGFPSAPNADATVQDQIGSSTDGSAVIVVSALDADGEAITGTYAQPVTIADSDTTQYGSYVTTGTCPASASLYTSAQPTAVTLISDTTTASFCYGGIAENPPTLTVTATGATTPAETFQPKLSSPAAGTTSPAGVAGNPDTNGNAYVALFEPLGAGIGSTGSVTYTEAGWTDDPYDQVLDVFANLACSSGSSFNYATASAAPQGGSGTLVTITATGSPTVAACPLTITDDLQSNTTDSDGVNGDGVPFVQLDTSYTTSSFSVNAHNRKR